MKYTKWGVSDDDEDSCQQGHTSGEEDSVEEQLHPFVFVAIFNQVVVHSSFPQQVGTCLPVFTQHGNLISRRRQGFLFLLLFFAPGLEIDFLFLDISFVLENDSQLLQCLVVLLPERATLPCQTMMSILHSFRWTWIRLAQLPWSDRSPWYAHPSLHRGSKTSSPLDRNVQVKGHGVWFFSNWRSTPHDGAWTWLHPRRHQVLDFPLGVERFFGVLGVIIVGYSERLVWCCVRLLRPQLVRVWNRQHFLNDVFGASKSYFHVKWDRIWVLSGEAVMKFHLKVTKLLYTYLIKRDLE